MAKRKEPEYSCTAVYTEGCAQRLSEALLDIYYNEEKGINFKKDNSNEESV